MKKLSAISFLAAVIAVGFFYWYPTKSYWETEDFSELMRLSGLQATRPLSLEEIVPLVEGAWKIEGERFHPQMISEACSLNGTKIVELAKKLGFVDMKIPTRKYYDRVLFLGATTPRVRSRMQFGFSQIQRLGIATDKVVILGSTRDLHIGHDEDKAIAVKLAGKYPETEHGMQRYLWENELKDQIPTTLPQAIIWVNAEPSAHQARASLNETVAAWLVQDNMQDGMKVLAFSDQPHIAYQEKTLKKALASRGLSGVDVELAGESIGERCENIKVVLDAIRRDLVFASSL